jgi:hypothetical protein
MKVNHFAEWIAYVSMQLRLPTCKLGKSHQWWQKFPLRAANEACKAFSARVFIQLPVNKQDCHLLGVRSLVSVKNDRRRRGDGP